MDDATVVATFVAYLRDNGYPGLSIESRPDLENRKSPAIDAIAGSFAIEHTSIDTIENQRRDGIWFSHVADPLEDQFKGTLPFRLRLVFPYTSIVKGQDWNAIREALAAWISSQALGLLDGTHNVAIPSVPFEFRVVKDSKRRPGLIFARIDPGDTTLATRVFGQLSRKAAKLRPHRAIGRTTVLLVDSSDMALMSHEAMLDSIQLAFGSRMPEGVDQLWYADTSIESELEFWDFTSALTRSSADQRAV